MNKNKSFHDHIIQDVLENSSNISSKAMFGGYAIYRNKKIVGIIINNELYIKENENNKKIFEDQKSKPFEYQRKTGKKYQMRYWLVPEKIFEDKEMLERCLKQTIDPK